MAAVSDPKLLGVEPEVGILALERPPSKRLDPLVELAAERRDPVLGHPVDAELLDEAVDLAGRDPVDVGLHHDRDDRLLGRAAGLEEGGEVGLAGALSGDEQVELADPGLPAPGAVAVSVRCPVGRDLAAGGADLLRDLGLHQLRGDERDRLARKSACSEIRVLATTSAVVMLWLSAIVVLLRRSTCRSTDESGARGGRNFRRPVPRDRP